MKVKTVPSKWIYEPGLRLDVGPYLGGAREARDKLAKLSAKKAPLHTVTSGFDGGIYNGPHFSRVWVDTPEYGVPFLGTSSMLMADLSNLPLLSKKAANSPKLSYLKIEPGMTLISCSGTIGRMAYTRPDMDGMWTSQHIMKVVADPDKIPPGYLYAYLSSKFGVPLIVSGTYGAIIQHIEPHHIADLPVPRLGDELEGRVHELVQEAAQARSLAAKLRQQAETILMEAFHLPALSDHISTNFNTFIVNLSEMVRLDAAHYNPYTMDAEKALRNTKYPKKKIGNVCRVFTPGIFKRPYVDDPNYGYPYFSGSELFQNDASPRGYLNKKAPGIRNYIIQKNWLLIQDAGQVGGLIGQLVRATASVDSSVVSNHLMRIVAEDDIDAAYMFSILNSRYGYRAVIGHAFGTSIPQLDPKHIADITIPWPAPEQRARLAAPILESWQLQDRAIEAERIAVLIVEQTIEAGA